MLQILSNAPPLYLTQNCSGYYRIIIKIKIKMAWQKNEMKFGKKKNRNRTTDIYYTGKTNRALMRHELQLWMLLIGNKRKEFLFLCLAWWGCLIKWVAWIVKKRAGVKKKKKNLQCVTIKQLWQAYNLSHQLFAFLGENGRPMQVADAAASVYALHDVCYVFRTIFHSYASLITRKLWDIH